MVGSGAGKNPPLPLQPLYLSYPPNQDTMISGGTPSGGESSSFLRLLGPVTLGLGLGLISWKSSFLAVKHGYHAVVVDCFTGVAHTLGEGTHFLLPGRYTQYMVDVRPRPYNISARPATRDLQKVDINLCLVLSPDRAKLPSFLKSLGLNFTEQILPAFGNEVLHAVVNGYGAEELFSSRADFVVRLKEEFIKKAKVYSMAVVDVFVSELDFTPEFTSAVEKKLLAQMEKDTATPEAETSGVLLPRSENVAQAAITPAGDEIQPASLGH
ncbi:OLC1v1011714C1 [Oldenlandia corymbosa var. corymbosa]|uniref:Prohibitin n=1 Tax=Oldenlandia corymbosa var. corymbosa TaxID=529605 RepID=A0AAV1DUA9_OLDCO|nr:OLC1v1011714C1 [Oldenlandia corymbosa var. corymbosa]